MLNLSTKKKIIALIALIIAAAALFCVYTVFREKPSSQSFMSDEEALSSDSKSVIIELIDANGTLTEYKIWTHAEFLKGVMNKADGLEYETVDGMVMIVNGERADYTLDGTYWAFYVNGEYCRYGIADQPVNDGDVFRIEYTKA